MSWRTVIEDDILTGLSGPETAAFKTAALKMGQADPLVAIIATTVGEARGYLASQVTLGAGETVPEGVIHHVIAIVRYRYMTRVGINPSKSRELEYKDARKFLQDVGRGLAKFESPETETEEEIGAPLPKIIARRRDFEREDQDGI